MAQRPIAGVKETRPGGKNDHLRQYRGPDGISKIDSDIDSVVSKANYGNRAVADDNKSLKRPGMDKYPSVKSATEKHRTGMTSAVKNTERSYSALLKDKKQLKSDMARSSTKRDLYSYNTRKLTK